FKNIPKHNKKETNKTTSQGIPCFEIRDNIIGA
ncbi:hypothetical protein HAINFHK1212_1997, partial [Haemophilus influenzae HK1212]